MMAQLARVGAKAAMMRSMAAANSTGSMIFHFSRPGGKLLSSHISPQPPPPQHAHDLYSISYVAYSGMPPQGRRGDEDRQTQQQQVRGRVRETDSETEGAGHSDKRHKTAETS